jgi:hypothetical protein
MGSNSSRPAGQPGRGGSTLAAFLFGLPLAGLIIGLFRYGPLQASPLARYVEHYVQWAVVCLFCVAVGALLVKLLRLRVEFDALARDILPRWDGTPAGVEKASELLGSVNRQDERIQGTYLGRRLRAVLEFIGQRRGTAQFDDHLRALADADSVAQEGSFGLVKFLTWALPILGFLGTVLGITQAIAGITPEGLEENIGQLTGGLAEAFDSTALALALTMVCMFLTFLVERREMSLLEEVDGYVDRHLAHRFQAEGSGQTAGAALAQVVETLTSRLAEPEQRAADAYRHMTEQLVAGLSRAMEGTLKAHEQRLAALEQQSVQQLAGLAMAVRDTGREQQQALARVAEGISAQAGVLAHIQADEANLVHLQAVLHQNLAALASASNFEEAVHSLTAAVHLLTSRAPRLADAAPLATRKSA